MKTNALHSRLIELAESLVDRHTATDADGETYFNLHTYMNELASEIDGIFFGRSAPNGNFELSADHVARYIWCCIDRPEMPDACTFRGMDIYD